jgi:hypothetical protein
MHNDQLEKLALGLRKAQKEQTLACSFCVKSRSYNRSLPTTSYTSNYGIGEGT